MGSLSQAYRPVHQGYPEFKTKLARINDLRALELEASEARQSHVADACARLRTRLVIGAALDPEDCNVVQTYIGSRTSQDRYGH